jgi:hypothetical protein
MTVVLWRAAANVHMCFRGELPWVRLTPSTYKSSITINILYYNNLLLLSLALMFVAIATFLEFLASDTTQFKTCYNFNCCGQLWNNMHKHHSIDLLCKEMQYEVCNARICAQRSMGSKFTILFSYNIDLLWFRCKFSPHTIILIYNRQNFKWGHRSSVKLWWIYLFCYYYGVNLHHLPSEFVKWCKILP